MKNFKKIASAIAALSLAACVAVPMSATVFTASATTVTVTENTADKATHTYTVYPIFTGTYSEESGVKTLSNVVWADSFQKDKLLADDEFAKLLGFGDTSSLTGKSAAEISKLIGEKCKDNNANSEKLAKIIGQYVGTSGTEVTADGAKVETAGYYIVKDVYTAADDETGGNKTPGSTSFHMLGVISGKTNDELEFTAKKGLPTFEKKLKDVNDSTGVETEWQDSADYDIGDTVPFQLKATLPEDYARYDKYKLVFHDTLGTEFNTPDGFKAWIDTDGDGSYKKGTDVDLTVGAVSTNEFDITFDDIKTLDADKKAEAGDTVYVEYNAVLNNSAKLGSVGNWNTAYLEYSNNPNVSGSGAGDSTDKTPVDKVVVFTYKLDIDKVKEDTTSPLTGAEFKLYKKYATLGDKTDGTETLKGYLGTAGSSLEGTWVEVDINAEVEDPKFQFKGIDDGDYYLVESNTPAGYNSIAPIPFTVSAEHETEADEPKLTNLTGNDTSGDVTVLTFTAVNEKDENGETDKAGGSQNEGLATKVVNKAGATLPSTGGIGTTLFYLGGGALVAVAGVMLITKKRMTKE